MTQHRRDWELFLKACFAPVYWLLVFAWGITKLLCWVLFIVLIGWWLS